MAVATKDWEAVLYALKNSVAVTSIVADNGDGVPLIVYGNFAIEQTGVPSIAFSRLDKENNYGIEDGLFMVNCYADSQYESSDLSEIVNDIFRDSMGNHNGYPLTTNSKIYRSIPDGICWNTPVEIRIIHGGF